jgi:hypothetical protein
MNTRPLLILTLFLAALPLGACWPTDTQPPNLVGTGMDMFGPVALRIHPLTRITADGAAPGGKLLEVRIELTDQMRDITKGVGVMHFTLRRAEVFTTTIVDQWEVPIDTPQANIARWDSITRTYLFNRPLPPQADGKDLLLEATLTLPNGDQLKGKFPLK